jgi:hypothetical protein
MTANLENYVAAGFFLSRHAGLCDCAGLDLRRITMAHDHSQRRFFPESWTLSWCSESREERLERAAVFGIGERDLERVIAWADQSFGSEFGAWDVIFTLEGARAAVRSFLQNATNLELWGVGLHRSLVADFCKASAPPPQVPGYAPTGASGLHVATCERPAHLADGGTVLGHEILIPEFGASFNSPESRHLDEQAAFRASGVVPNGLGLVDSFEDALSCCRYLDAHASETQHQVRGWLPWLIVRYPL